MPLAQTVFQKDFDAETGEALRAKTLELLLALDVIASASHDLAQVADAAGKFKTDFEKNFDTTYMSQAVFDDFKTLRTSDSDIETRTKDKHPSFLIASAQNTATERVKARRVSGVTKVEKGNILEVSTINPESTSDNQNIAPFLSKAHRDEVDKQDTFRRESMNALRDNIQNPLNRITTLERLGGGDADIDTSLSKSFLMDSSFNGILNDTDKKAISDYADKHKLKVQTSDKDTTDYIKQLSDKSDKNQKKFDLEEQKRSKDIETKTSKEEATAPASAPASPAPSVMVTGGGPRGNAPVYGGGGSRQNASFGRDRSNGRDLKAMLENSEKNGEIDIDKLLSDMLEENKKEGAENTVEGVTSSLPEGSYSVVNGPDGKPLGYKVNEELGGGVFLFDSESGKSTALMMTNKDNVFMNPETGKYYRMNFPEPADSATAETSTESSESDTTSPTITEIESDAEPIKKEIDLSTLNQDMLQDQGLLRTERDGEVFYSHYEDGKITYMVDEHGKRVDQSIIDEINSKPENISIEDASSTFEVPPSLSEMFS